MTHTYGTVHTESLTIGDRLVLRIDGREVNLTVWRISPAGSAGTRHSDGPHIHAHTRPGGYGITFDRGSMHYPDIRLA